MAVCQRQCARISRPGANNLTQPANNKPSQPLSDHSACSPASRSKHSPTASVLVVDPLEVMLTRARIFSTNYVPPYGYTGNADSESAHETPNRGPGLDCDGRANHVHDRDMQTVVQTGSAASGVVQICDGVLLAGQMSEAEIGEMVCAAGLRSVLNLRTPAEFDACRDGHEPDGRPCLGSHERDIVEGLGLTYLHVPVPRDGPYPAELCATVSQALGGLVSAGRAPVLVHCRSGARAKEVLKAAIDEGLLDESPCKPICVMDNSCAPFPASAGELPAAGFTGTMIAGSQMGVPMVPVHFQQPVSLPAPPHVAVTIVGAHIGTCHEPLASSGFGREPAQVQEGSVGKASKEVVTEVLQVPADSQPADNVPTVDWRLTLAAAVCMGLFFGVFMDLSKVTLPIVIREQFIFQRFIMLKVFLGATGTSAFVFSLLSKVSAARFAAAREAFFPGLVNKGMAATTLGPFILGAGMALAGACPGMVLIQCGSGVTSGLIALAGGLLAAALFGVVQAHLHPLMASCNIKMARAEDLSPLKSVPFSLLALGMCVACFAVIVILEVYFPWASAGKLLQKPPHWAWTAEMSGFFEPWDNYMPPALMGVGIGLLQVPCVLLCNDSLGSSSAYMTLTSQLLVSTEMREKLPHWSGFRSGVGNWWQAVYILSAILGAFISSWSVGTFNKGKSVKDWEAFVGGFLMIFGSRIGSGCTSGHGLSGMGLLALKSIVAVPAMFAGGIFVGFLYQTIDPAGYTGFAAANLIQAPP